MAEDTIFSKRFFLYVLAGGAALALIIKYLFFDGTTGTAIFGIVWLLTLIVLAIMTVRDKEDGQESEVAMREYSGLAVVQEYNGQAAQGYRMMDEMPVQFYCNCSKERVSRALISLGTKELDEMIQEGKPIEMNCHFCNSHYTFTVEELKQMLEAVRR